MEQPQQPSLEQKFDRMIELLEKIHDHFNPPLWKRGLRFLFTHFITIISLLFLAYATWEIWELVSGIEQSVVEWKEYMGEQFQKVKFW